MLRLVKPMSSKVLLEYQNKTGNIFMKEVDKIAKQYSAYTIAYLEPTYGCPEELDLEVFFNLRLLPNIQKRKIIGYKTKNHLSPIFKELSKEFILL